MNYNFFIIGGDKRMYYLAKKLAKDENRVRVLGFEKIGYEELLNNNIKLVHSINDIEDNEILIGGIPITKDNETFYMPYSEKKIYLKELNERTIIAGNIPNIINGIDILKDESFQIFNSIPTVEGAIAKAIQENDGTINDSNILVLGFGRIGKILCNRLKGMGANVFCTARKKEDLAWIKAYGYKEVQYEELEKRLCKIDMIFNTVPSTILDKKKLLLLREDVLIIDLASNPGGVDKKTAERLNIKIDHYLGIPGKVAPEKTSQYIMKRIYKIMETKNKEN